jgi:hypothetical protein
MSSSCAGLRDAVWSNITYIVRAAIDGTVVDPELEDAAVAKALAESHGGRDRVFRPDSFDEKGDDEFSSRSAASSVASIRRCAIHTATCCGDMNYKPPLFNLVRFWLYFLLLRLVM